MQSSTGEGLSLRVTGYLTALIPAIVLVSNLIGHPITEVDLNSLSSAFNLLIYSVWGILGAYMTTIGWIRRNFYKQNQLGVFSQHFEGRK